MLLRVDVEQAEYWDTPGGKVASLISFAKTKLTGETYDAEHGSGGPVGEADTLPRRRILVDHRY